MSAVNVFIRTILKNLVISLFRKYIVAGYVKCDIETYVINILFRKKR